MKTNELDNINVRAKMKVKEKHKCKRISRGHYMYRGFQIICVGYYNPEHRVCWEAIDEDGRSGFAHSYSLKDTKAEIDYELDKGKRKNTIVDKDKM